jgi:hypothetical protein
LRHGLRGWAVLGLRRRLRLRLRSGTVLGLRRRLRLRLRGGAVLGLRLRLNWTVLRLLGTELRLLRLLVAELWLLRLDRAGVRLARADLRLLWLSLRLVGSVVRLCRPELLLGGAVVGVYRLAGTDFGLTRSYVWLAGAVWLYLRPVVWFAWAVALLAWAGFGLVGAVGHRSRVGAGEARLRGDGPRGCDHGWAASVYVVELLPVLGGFALMLDLGGHGRDSRTTHGFDFGRSRPVSDAASASVVGDMGVVVDDDSAVVDVGDVDVDPVDGAVVVKIVAAPIAAVIADPGVAKAVVDPAVKADVGTPEAAVEAVSLVIPAPVAWGPEGAVVRRSAPCSGDPVVAGGSPVPVTGGPDIVGRGGFRLLVDGQGRGRLVGVFDGRGFAFFVELVGGLGVLISLVLIGWGRSRFLRGILLWRILLGGILLRTLLGLNLVADSEDCALRRGGDSR